VVERAGKPLPSGMRWILVASMAATLLIIAILRRVTQHDPEHQRIYRMAGRMMVLSASLILLLDFFHLFTIPLRVAVVLLLLAPLLFAFRIWIETLEPVG
jgi:hypothetical protein